MIAQWLCKRRGVIALEFIGLQPDCVRYLLKVLANLGVIRKEALDVIEEEKHTRYAGLTQWNCSPRNRSDSHK